MKTFIISLLCSALLSCGSKHESAPQSELRVTSGYSPEAQLMKEALDESPSDLVEPDPMSASEAQVPVERKLIRTGSIRFEVEDLAATKSKIEAMVQAMGGYISSENTQNYGESKEQNMQIRVPAPRFDSLLQQIENQAQKIESRQINAQDVTEEFIDIQARLTTKKELEKRYAELLGIAKNVEEMLSIERQLEEVRGEIESMEGRLNYLSKQVNFSTLDVSFYVYKGDTGSSFFHDLGRGFGNGWENLLLFIVGLVNLWPFVILSILAIWGINRWRTMRKKKS